MDDVVRCNWCGTDPDYVVYHDTEWGVPSHDDKHLFEMLILEGAQAGLSWITILRKRANYRLAFDQFDAEKIARYDSAKVESLLLNPGIVRNRLKVESAILSAKAYLKLKEQYGSLAEYLWQFVEGKPIQNQIAPIRDIVPRTAVSDKLSKDLKKRGFKFVGSTICYAFMQATGLVNDHLLTCFRYSEVAKMG